MNLDRGHLTLLHMYDICLQQSFPQLDLVESQARRDGRVSSPHGERRTQEKRLLSLVGAKEPGAQGRKHSKCAACAVMSDPQGKAAPNEEANVSEVTTGNVVPGGASLSSPVASIQTPATTATEDEDESEDESEILEESPCGRWQKRREEVDSHICLPSSYCEMTLISTRQSELFMDKLGTYD